MFDEQCNAIGSTSSHSLYSEALTEGMPIRDWAHWIEALVAEAICDSDGDAFMAMPRMKSMASKTVAENRQLWAHLTRLFELTAAVREAAPCASSGRNSLMARALTVVAIQDFTQLYTSQRGAVVTWAVLKWIKGRVKSPVHSSPLRLLSQGIVKLSECSQSAAAMPRGLLLTDDVAAQRLRVILFRHMASFKANDHHQRDMEASSVIACIGNSDGYKVGECVEYWSYTHKRWLKARVSRQRGMSTYDLDIRKGADEAQIRRLPAVWEFPQAKVPSETGATIASSASSDCSQPAQEPHRRPSAQAAGPAITMAAADVVQVPGPTASSALQPPSFHTDCFQPAQRGEQADLAQVGNDLEAVPLRRAENVGRLHQCIGQLRPQQGAPVHQAYVLAGDRHPGMNQPLYPSPRQHTVRSAAHLNSSRDAALDSPLPQSCRTAEVRYISNTPDFNFAPAQICAVAGRPAACSSPFQNGRGYWVNASALSPCTR